MYIEKSEYGIVAITAPCQGANRGSIPLTRSTLSFVMIVEFSFYKFFFNQSK